MYIHCFGIRRVVPSEIFFILQDLVVASELPLAFIVSNQSSFILTLDINKTQVPLTG